MHVSDRNKTSGEHRRIEKWVFHGCARLQVLEIRHDPEYIGEWIINKAARILLLPGIQSGCVLPGVRIYRGVHRIRKRMYMEKGEKPE